jgi:hypothetical protein
VAWLWGIESKYVCNPYESQVQFLDNRVLGLKLHVRDQAAFMRRDYGPVKIFENFGTGLFGDMAIASNSDAAMDIGSFSTHALFLSGGRWGQRKLATLSKV